MALAEYKRKRNFKNTPEPGAKVERSKKQRFVIQRHEATRLHYDFRLEMDGVLKSWAVPKGPSLNPSDKRLAVMVEDHPVSYIDFYGSIPEGNYGAGTVDVWDMGTYFPINPEGEAVSEKEALKALDAGNLKFSLKGKHLKGEFALVRLKDEKNWLLIKHRDKYAVDDEYTSEDKKPVKSHKRGGVWESNRNTKKPAAKKKAAVKKKPEKKQEKKVNKAPLHSRFNPGRKLSDFISPMLASIGDEPFDSPDWIFELKWDGYRAIAECDKTSVKLYSRNGLSFNDRFPPVVDQLEKMRLNAVLDGEIVLMNEKDLPDFQKLQHYEQNQHLPLIYYVFDILYKNGKNLQELPLLERKDILKKLLKGNPVIRYSDHVEEKGKDFFREVSKLEMEGIMAKKAESTYATGVRTREWLKIKNVQTREAIIAGYTEGRGSRKHFGALVLGEFKKGKLEYIGHTGTGFNTQTLKELWTLMQEYKQSESPFGKKIAVNSAVTWLNPKLVCEIKYAEITRDGILRHPVFLRLRDDKNPGEVNEKQEKSVKMKKKSSGKSENENDKTLTINRHKVELSNINKIYWPDDKITKGDMLNYYEAVADFILPYLKDRPLSLNRHPNGISGKSFYQKNAGDIAPSWMKTKDVISGTDGRNIEYLVCNNKESLLFIANLGCIEMNPWNSTTKKMENPSWMVIDIDPSDDNTFEDVIDTAQVVKSICDSAGIKCYCKTSGSTGLHVYVPMGAKYDYEQVKNFANIIAMMVTDELPDITTLTRSLSKRSSKKIYVDYLQNRRGQTLATTYSLRPKPEAPVSMPLEWKEVKKGLQPTDFNIYNALARIKKKGDIFNPVLGTGIDLKKALKKLGA